MIRRPPISTPFPSTTLFRSVGGPPGTAVRPPLLVQEDHLGADVERPALGLELVHVVDRANVVRPGRAGDEEADRKSTRLNSSHANISYAVFCLKKKKK